MVSSDVIPVVCFFKIMYFEWLYLFRVRLLLRLASDTKAGGLGMSYSMRSLK